MTDKDKLLKLRKLADAMYYAAQHLTTDASRLHKAMDEYHQFIINEYHKKEPTIPDIVDEHFYEMLGEEPVSEEQVKEDTMTIRKEWFEHCRKSWYNEGYIDGTHNRDRQFKEPVSDDLEKAMQHDAPDNIGIDDLLYWRNGFIAGVKWKEELFEKNRIAACDKQTEEEAEREYDFVMGIIENEHRHPTFDDAIKYGMKKMKEQMMAKAIDGEVTHGKSLAIPSLGYRLDKEGFDFGDKVKVLVVKED